MLNDFSKAVKYYKARLILDPKNCDINLQLIFCGLLYSKGQINNAINYLTLYILKKGLNTTNYVFNAFLSFLYKEKSISPSVNASNSLKSIKN